MDHQTMTMPTPGSFWLHKGWPGSLLGHRFHRFYEIIAILDFGTVLLRTAAHPLGETYHRISARYFADGSCIPVNRDQVNYQAFRLGPIKEDVAELMKRVEAMRAEECQQS